LQEERERLRETDSFTILEYIKTSIEILMNMKMEEHQAEMAKNKKLSKKKGGKSKSKANSESGAKGMLGGVEDDDEASDSGSEVGKSDRMNDYEQML